MGSWPPNLVDQVDILSKVATFAFAVIGGIWILIQYREGTRLKAAETLLKVEEEFRNVIPSFERIEILSTYQSEIVPVISAYLDKLPIDETDLQKLIALDRMFRFLYMCSVLDHTMRGESGRALQKAYYYYLGMLLPESLSARPELLKYTAGEYPRLTRWVAEHRRQLIAFRDPSPRWRRLLRGFLPD
jgi:hypothetical protein